MEMEKTTINKSAKAQCLARKAQVRADAAHKGNFTKPLTWLPNVELPVKSSRVHQEAA